MKDKKVSEVNKVAFDYFVKQAKDHWASLGSRMSRAHLALALHRLGQKEVPQLVTRSLKENAKVTEEQEQSAITCACEPGDILMMSPLILHASSRSTQPARRRILHFEYAREKDLDPDLEWHEPN